jgi:hypothetical protein
MGIYYTIKLYFSGKTFVPSDDCATGLGKWATSKDPILQRYGVGALARIAVAGPEALEALRSAKALEKLVGALESTDAQAQCFAAGAIGGLTWCTQSSASRVSNNSKAWQISFLLPLIS